MGFILRLWSDMVDYVCVAQHQTKRNDFALTMTFSSGSFLKHEYNIYIKDTQLMNPFLNAMTSVDLPNKRPFASICFSNKWSLFAEDQLTKLFFFVSFLSSTQNQMFVIKMWNGSAFYLPHSVYVYLSIAEPFSFQILHRTVYLPFNSSN